MRRSRMASRGFRTPSHARPVLRSGSDLSVGERAAVRMRNATSSWTFVGSLFAAVSLWVVQHVSSIGKKVGAELADLPPGATNPTTA